MVKQIPKKQRQKQKSTPRPAQENPIIEYVVISGTTKSNSRNRKDWDIKIPVLVLKKPAMARYTVSKYVSIHNITGEYGALPEKYANGYFILHNEAEDTGYL